MWRIVAIAVCLVGCKSTGVTGDASAPDGPGDEVRGCTVAGDCAVGVNYRDEGDCAEPAAYRASYVEAEECITALGEVPGGGCLDCSVTTESGRGGRLEPGNRWVLECVEETCQAVEERCGEEACPSEGPCDTSLDCFLTCHCLEGTCTSGCDTGFDCRTTQVCVREPPDAEYGRCVFSG